MRRRASEVVSDLEDLLEAAEPNPLLARVDALATNREWDGLVELARRCRQAVERGKQLWPIAEHIDYRLALEAPGPYAGAVLDPEAGRFALGPLTEVAASTHSFAELSGHIQSPQSSGIVAAERVVRGEDLRAASGTHPEILEMPLVLSEWEPAYPLAVYRASKAVFPDPHVNSRPIPEPDVRFEPTEDEEVRLALMGLVDVWVSQSNGEVEVCTGEGTAAGAVAALGFDGFTIGEITAGEAFAVMAWAAASGGARGRRRGAAFGRYAAWWAGCTVTGLEWPPEPTELGAAVSELSWFLWEPPEGVKGWNLHLAVASPTGPGAAIAATDRMEKD
jgi:hypothetical protein